MRLRRVLLVAFLALAVPVAAASLAYACTALATMTVTSAAPGQTVSGTGKGFNGGGHGTPAGSTPVELRLDTRSGPLLATAVPLDAAGNIAFSFPAPNVSPGQHVLIGIQTNPANGTPFYGTPARQTLTILASPARATAERGEGTGASSSGSTTDPQAPGARAGAEEPVTAGPSAVAPGSPSVQPVPGPGAAASVQPAASSGAGATGATAVQVTPASASARAPLEAGSGGAQPPSTPGGIGAASAVGEPTAVTTATPGLVLASTGERSSSLPVLVLMLLGLGIGLAASARLVTSLPLLRRGSGATAT